MSVLRGLERACRKHASIRAEMFYRVMNLTMGDQETRTGWVAYRRKGPGDDEKPVTRFRIHFDTVQLDSGPVAERKVDFAFDGERLTIARHRIEQITRYRLGPGARRPVTIGEGPFPLPFGQRAAEMIEYFRITTAETRGRLAHTKYLKLVPRKDHATRLNVSYVKMWVDEKTWLPVKIESADKKDNRTLLVFRNVRTDVELPDDLFRLPTPDGWHETVENLGEADSLAP
ncbi:MAG: LolA family protein [Planctomycetota bacterium]